MVFNVYADLSRSLSSQERHLLADALDSIVPGSGCVGGQGGPCDEVYFTVGAANIEEANVRASAYLNLLCKKIGSGIEYTIELTLSSNS